jgi:hypothetical protein
VFGAHVGPIEGVRVRAVIVGDAAAISRPAELEREMIGRSTADHELPEVDCSVV